MSHRLIRGCFAIVASGLLLCAVGDAAAGLNQAALFSGHVGMSIDGVGSNNSPVGDIQVLMPAGSTVLKAFLYSAGTPFPWYSNSPTTLDAYNGAGITLAGNAITNFDTLVGATATPRPEIGRFFTARADVTGLMQTLTSVGGPLFNFSVSEGTLNNRIDGEALVVMYSNPALPLGSVAVLDGGQNTGGETSVVSFAGPIGDPNGPGFLAQMSIADSFSCCGQESTIAINGSLLTSHAGNLDDGAASVDGSLITVGGLGDSFSNGQNYGNDHEFYNLAPFLTQGDTSFSIHTVNPTSDDNIFAMFLQTSAQISVITPTPEPATVVLFGLGLAGLAALRRRR
jgi:hypothetical protein